MKTRKLGILLGTLAALLNSAHAQNSDALLNKLVQKGILSSKEADDLRKENDAAASKVLHAKAGVPDWVTSLKIGGDFRARYDQIASENEAFLDRHRFRYRLRAGMVANMLDNFEVGFRLTSSENQENNFGGDPISGNSTMQNNGSKKFIFIDQAYAKWSPTLSDTMRNSIIVGKMENPFVYSDVVFDADYTPEGIADQFSWNITDAQTLRLTGAAFALDELSGSSHDPYYYGGQIRLDSKWSPRIETSAGVAAYILQNPGSLVNAAVPNINAGNTREGAAGELAYHFNPVYADASLTYKLDHFPLYPGACPIKVFGDVVNNPAAPTRNSAFSGGVQLGRSGKKGAWDLSYRYRFVEADSTYEEFAESDFGAFYPSAPTSFGGGGYKAGTNLKGHVIRANYSVSHSLTFGLTYVLAELLQDDKFVSSKADSDTKTGRLLMDALWKF